MRVEQDDIAARAILERAGLAIVPPFIGLVARTDGGEIKGAAVVSHFDGEDCEIQCEGFQYWSIGTIRALFRYVLDGLKVSRVSARTLASNARSMDGLRLIGFRQEGIKRKAHNGEDVMMFGMLREECRLLPRGAV